ncbi:MAG: glycosyltransferase family 2 protein, partial [Candidatus Omnitrophica bacterium]|nr:glycosyltransferase family 2 protein [Candidatus Omnitrophota bacterium]
SQDKMKVSVLIPAHNEERAIALTLRNIACLVSPEIIDKIVIINDHSADNTKGVVEQQASRYPHLNIQLIDNQGRLGFANALRAGMLQVSSGFIVHVMADNCDRVEDIPLMLNKMVAGGFDMACASRYSYSGKRCGGNWLKGFFSRFVGISLNKIINIPTRDASNAFKMYNSAILKDIVLSSSGFEISVELCVKAYLSGYNITELPTVWHAEDCGDSDFRILNEFSAYINIYLWAVFKYFKNRICRRKINKK